MQLHNYGDAEIFTGGAVVMVVVVVGVCVPSIYFSPQGVQPTLGTNTKL